MKQAIIITIMAMLLTWLAYDKLETYWICYQADQGMAIQLAPPNYHKAMKKGRES
jgi:hypothetical protein